MNALALPAWLGIFTLAAAVVWLAGIKIADVTDVLDERFDLGEAMGGMVLLAIVTNLPEVAIVSSAAMRGSMDIAVGNIVGGIAIQTVVLAVLDLWGVGRTAALTSLVDAPALLIEGVLVIFVLALTAIGHLMPSTLIYLHLTPIPVVIVLTWMGGVYAIAHIRKSPSYATEKPKKSAADGPTSRYVGVFIVGALATLFAGVTL